MILIALTTWVGLWLNGMSAALLGLQAGFVSFVPSRRPASRRELPADVDARLVVVLGARLVALGIALATPLVAVIQVAVVRLSIEDRLGGA